jgi:DNA-binding NarL/FixJ family response regulator
MDTISILIADDNHVLRAIVRHTLNKDGRFTVVGECDNGLSAVELAKALNPRVVLMDINMPLMDGMEATRIIKKEYKLDCLVLSISAYGEEVFCNTIMEMGASGYLTKCALHKHLVTAILEVNSGRNYVFITDDKLLVDTNVIEH